MALSPKPLDTLPHAKFGQAERSFGAITLGTGPGQIRHDRLSPSANRDDMINGTLVQRCVGTAIMAPPAIADIDDQALIGRWALQGTHGECSFPA
jgi:hypothetical protein